MDLSANVQGLEPSATLAVAALARDLRAQGRDIVDLSAGEPDFPTPGFVAEAGIASIRDGHTRYTPAAGIPALRQAIARGLAHTSGRDVDPAGIVVTAGAKQALFNVCFCLFGAGDRVLLPAPYWTSYPDLIRLARAEPVLVEGDPERGFKLSPEDLDAAWDERLRGLILNSPANPTGLVYTRAELDSLVRWAVERGVWVISDEIYQRIFYVAPRAAGLLDLDPELLGRAVVINGASKVYAMTGWRIGFSCTGPALAERMAALQSHVTSNAAAASQYAALAAFEEDPRHAAEIERMLETFRRRREALLRLLERELPGASYARPDGAFYLFLRADSYYDADHADSIAFCRALLAETGVALVPGKAFGDDRYVRLSFAASEETIAEGVRRLAGAVRAREDVAASRAD